MPTMTSNAKRKGPIGKATQTVGQVGDYLDQSLGKVIGMNNPNWLMSLGEGPREKVFVVMRGLNDEVDKLEKKHRELSPRYGEIAAGGAHMDPFFKTEAIRGFLRSLRNGGTPEEAVAAGSTDADYAVEKWNKSRGRDYHTHRSAKGSQDSILWDYARRVIRAAGSNPAKFERCVKDVQESGEDVNAYAVCTAAGTRNPKTKLDLMLDQVKYGKREITFDVRDWNKSDVDRLISMAETRGLDAASDGKHVLVRDLRGKNKRKGNINWSPERQGLYDAMEKARSSWVRASAQTGHKVTGGVKELEQKYKQAEARFVEAVRKTNPLAGGMTLRQLINHRLEQAYEMKAKLKTLPPRKQADYQREVYKAFSAVEMAEGVWHELGETREAEARIKSIFMGIPWENKRNPDDPEFADYGRRVVVISKVGRHVEEMEGTIYRTLQGSGGIVYEVDFGHGPQRLSGEQSRTIKFLNGKANPEMDAAAMYESFHGMPSEEVTEFEEEIHYHENLSELGVLCGLIVETEYAGTMALAFSGYEWDKREGAFELKDGMENPLFGGLFGSKTTTYHAKGGTTTTTGRLNYKGHQILHVGSEYEVPGVDPESRFESVKEAKRFIDEWSKNPRKGPAWLEGASAGAEYARSTGHRDISDTELDRAADDEIRERKIKDKAYGIKPRSGLATRWDSRQGIKTSWYTKFGRTPEGDRIQTLCRRTLHS